MHLPQINKQDRAQCFSEHFTVALPETTREIAAYFAERRARLKIVKTTTTPSGQMLDWIPIDSQFIGKKIPDLRAIATPEMLHIGKRPNLVSFELNDPAVDRGPDGTVPVMRRDFSKTRVAGRLKNYLAKKGPDGRRIAERARGNR
jgi:hypothetical protein